MLRYGKVIRDLQNIFKLLTDDSKHTASKVCRHYVHNLNTHSKRENERVSIVLVHGV